MNKICKNCQAQFVVEPDDFAFYEKIQVPPPTWCPDCRALRRFSWRNDRTLYRRNCDMCEKSIVTMYNPSRSFPVYCPSCWWADGWDTTAYGQEYDFNKTFTEQFKSLQQATPRIALMGKNSVNSEYTNHSSDNKNCFMCSSAMFCEDVMYSDFIFQSRDTLDCMMIYAKAERCYECINADNSYQCQFSILINNCSNCYYCYDLRGCTDCFLSTNLRNKSYVFLNEQLTKEEYMAKVKEFNLGSYATRKKLLDQFKELVEKQALHKYATIENSVNATGNYIFDSKNAHHSFDIADCEDVAYVSSVENNVKDTRDSYRNADNIELVHEGNGLIRVSHLKTCNLSYDISLSSYCDNCFNSQNLFGCISVKKGEYMILNKKYSKEEYTALKEKITEKMKTDGEYGEFFSMTISPFAYNESHAQLYAPLTKEQVLDKGWTWEDDIPGTYGKETIQPEDIPDDIQDVDESILKAILKCITCTRNYNVVQPELQFYQKENIPVPRQCFPCRDQRRIQARTPRKLWHRQCMCNLANHQPHDASAQCPNEFETPYEDKRPEKVYCKECYEAEVV